MLQAILQILSDPQMVAILSVLAGIVGAKLHGKYPVLNWLLAALVAQAQRPAPAPAPAADPVVNHPIIKALIDGLKKLGVEIVPAPPPK